MKNMSFEAGTGTGVLEDFRAFTERFSDLNQGEDLVIINPLVIDRKNDDEFEPTHLVQALQILVTAIRSKRWPKNFDKSSEMHLVALSFECLAKTVRRDLVMGNQTNLETLKEVVGRLEVFIRELPMPSNYSSLMEAIESVKDSLRDATSWDSSQGFIFHVLSLAVYGMSDDLIRFKSAVNDCVDEVRLSVAGMISDQVKQILFLHLERVQILECLLTVLSFHILNFRRLAAY